jgi:hypothetical protein
MGQEEVGRPPKERPTTDAAELTGSILRGRRDEVNTSPLHPPDAYGTLRSWHFSPYELFILGRPLRPQDAR